MQCYGCRIEQKISAIFNCYFLPEFCCFPRSKSFECAGSSVIPMWNLDSQMYGVCFLPESIDRVCLMAVFFAEPKTQESLCDIEKNSMHWIKVYMIDEICVFQVLCNHRHFLYSMYLIGQFKFKTCLVSTLFGSICETVIVRTITVFLCSLLKILRFWKCYCVASLLLCVQLEAGSLCQTVAATIISCDVDFTMIGYLLF